MNSILLDESQERPIGPLWLCALLFPLLLGAGLWEQSRQGPVLPLKENYRTPLPDIIMKKSGAWRGSTTEDMNWRKPEIANRDWRSPSRETAVQGPQRSRHMNVLPKYQAEKDIHYDYTRKEQKDYIKAFEFNF